MERVAKAVKTLSAARDNYETTRKNYESAQKCYKSAQECYVSALNDYELALRGYISAEEDMASLDKYYGSDLWRQDLADDEAGLLPPDLKRGVLSEDGVWNLMVDARRLLNRIE